MQRWNWVGVIFLAGTASAMAALPPQYQRQDELEAIIAHVVEEIGVIDSIIMKDVDFYEVISGKCRMEVVIVDIAPEPSAEVMVGPRNFAVESGPVVCEQ
jgi:hypothetical protein